MLGEPMPGVMQPRSQRGGSDVDALGRNPLWWTMHASRLPRREDPLVYEVRRVAALSAALAGDYDLFNQMEFGPAYTSLCEDLWRGGRMTGSDWEWEVAGEPVLSPNGRMVAIRLYACCCVVDDESDDGAEAQVEKEIIADRWAVFDLAHNLLVDHGFVSE